MIEYRDLETFREYEQAVEVQREVWAFDKVETIPSRLLLIARHIGGQAIGAFDGRRLVGFCLAFPGLKRDGSPYLHSHMLGVLPGYRDRGIGRRLKLEQRNDALARGIKLIEWTFDPLELKNAFLNIERLGVIVRRYVLNAYGVTTSKLHAGMPTDRCIAEWYLDHPRTVAILEGRPREREPEKARISVPAMIDELRRSDLRQALKIQKDISEKFINHLQIGLAVTGLERDESGAAYVLSPWP